MPGAKMVECGSCAESISKSQGSIGCNICGKWFHGVCVKVSEKDLSALKVSAFICASCHGNLNKIRDSAGVAGVADEIRNLNKKLDSFINNHNVEINAMKSAIDNMRTEVSSCLSEMRTDIRKYSERIDHIESATSALKAENMALKAENNALHRRFNRGDFLIGGLPEGLDDLVAHVVDLAACFNVELSRSDVNHVCYINRRRKILVKLNSVDHRDKIMNQYFKTRTLRVCGVLSNRGGSDVTTRVYLNDHYTPAASHLNSVCNKLRRMNVITKFKILNGDRASVKILFPDGKEMVKDAEECALLLDEPNRSDL